MHRSEPLTNACIITGYFEIVTICGIYSAMLTGQLFHLSSTSVCLCCVPAFSSTCLTNFNTFSFEGLTPAPSCVSLDGAVGTSCHRRSRTVSPSAARQSYTSDILPLQPPPRKLSSQSESLTNLILLYPWGHVSARQWRATVLKLVLLEIFLENYSMFIMYHFN